MTHQPPTAVLKRLTICQCGYPALDKHIRPGTRFHVVENSDSEQNLICPGCFAVNRITCVWVHSTNQRGHSGYLPKGIFDFDAPP